MGRIPLRLCNGQTNVAIINRGTSIKNVNLSIFYLTSFNMPSVSFTLYERVRMISDKRERTNVNGTANTNRCKLAV